MTEMDPLEINKEDLSQNSDLNALSELELVDLLKSLVDKEIDEVKSQVDQIKQVFYKKHKLQIEELKKQWIENGGEDASFIYPKDENEEELKSLLNNFKTRKAAFFAKQEAEKEKNLLLKQHILDRMKVLVDSSDDVSVHINEFRELQKQWKEIGLVPQTAVTELWKHYSVLQESFWDLIKINNELREYDFKKNLEAKTHLCELAEKLDEEEDVISAFHQLQKFHEDWHEIGPVAREFREDIWQRFKAATTIINKKHQGHFDEIRSLEEDNLTAKTAICEKIEAVKVEDLNTYKSWDDATKLVMDFQEEWRTIGFAPKKSNHKIFERYRAACDAFFEAKALYYKEAKSTLTENLDKKKQLCEQAEALKDSSDWKATTDKMIELQKEWKTVGPVAKKYSDEIWKRFIAACDYFFDQKAKNSNDQKSVEIQNLQKKKELITFINELVINGTNNEEVLSKIREKIAEWNTIGHVPFKEKDKIYKEYRKVIDAKFEILQVDANKNRLENFKANLKDISSKGDNKVYKERDRLMRSYDHLKSEIAVYENNMGFLTTSSKKGSGLIKELERKIESLREEAKLIEQKIQMIDEEI